MRISHEGLFLYRLMPHLLGEAEKDFFGRSLLRIIPFSYAKVVKQKVFQWFADNIGQSVQSKRKEVKMIAKYAEQIRDCDIAEIIN